MKWAKRIIIAILTLPIGILLLWYLIGFLPYVNKMDSIVKNGKSNVLGAEERLFKMAVRSERNTGLRSFVMKSNYRRFGRDDEHQKMLYWHLNTAFWYFASHIHFDDKEIFNMWCEMAWYGKGVGIRSASVYYFNKPLPDLNDVEMASLVAITRAPSLYKLGSERLEQRVKYILDETTHNNVN